MRHVEAVTELQSIHNWRVEQFKELGIDNEYAELLAAEDADLELGRKMKKTGATAEQIVRILF